MSTQLEARADLITPSLKKSRRKWIYGGIAVIVVLGIAVPAILSKMQSGTSVAASNIYQVGTGEVVENIGTSGTIEVPTQISLQFQSANGNSTNIPTSILTSLPIAVGQTVKAGQVLATVDPSQEKLQVIQAESSVAQAKGNLASAQAALTQDLQGASQSQITQDEINVQKAQQSLAAAKIQYQDQLAVYNDRTSAKQQVTDAENTLKMAQQQAQNTVSNQQSIQSAQQKVASDESTITNDQTTLSTDQQTLATDQKTLAQYQAQYGVVTEAQVQQAYQQYQSEQELSIAWQNGAYSGSDPYTTPLDTAQSNYNLLNTEYTNLQNAQQTVTKDQAAVAKDQEALTLDKKQLATDQQAQTNAQSTSNYSDQQTQLQIQQDEQAVQAAIATYNDRTSAKQSLDNAKIQIQQDELSLKSAQATLKTDQSPADAATLAAARASVSNAQAALQSAEAQLQSDQLTLQNTVLRAPVAGLITAVNVTAGEPVSSSTVVATMEDNVKTDSQVQLTVSESQIESVKAGDPIALTINALPNTTFSGTVTQIYPLPTTTSNVTNYTVMATVDNSSGDLKPGMSANVNIQVADKKNVLTVPAISLVNMGSFEGVYVIGTRPKTGSYGGFGGHHFAGQGTGGSSGQSFGGSSSGHSFSGASGSSSGNSTGRTFGGGSGGFAGASANLPKGVYFQPVQVGVFGTNNVEITGGLTAGEKIMLVPPGSTASSSSSQQGSSNHATGMAFRAARGGA